MRPEVLILDAAKTADVNIWLLPRDAADWQILTALPTVDASARWGKVRSGDTVPVPLHLVYMPDDPARLLTEAATFFWELEPSSSRTVLVVTRPAVEVVKRVDDKELVCLTTKLGIARIDL